jgi:type IV pilus assembly protein PilW
MKKMVTAKSLHRNLGFSLIEVMVAMAVGIILLGAVSYLFVGSRQLNRTQSDTAQLQESGRYAMDILGRAIRQAGARKQSDVLGDEYAPVLNAVTVTNGTSPAADMISVSYFTSTANEIDCNGNAVAIDTRITYVFAVDTTNFQLTCSNGAATAVPIVEGVENMQILVGIDNNSDLVIDGYVTGNNVPARSGLQNYQTNVSAISVSLLMRSASDKVALNNQTYTFNGTATTATDLRLRQVYNATFTLRNMIKGD